MIISQTPVRISLAGGGSDLREFYGVEPGSVTSTTIDKFVYVTVNNRFDDTLRVSYSKTEVVQRPEEIEHPIIREALAKVGIKKGIEITSIADMPSGTGVGSSSAFTVGLLNALYASQGIHASAERLAQEACEIEIDRLKEPIGKQDQYAAAYGGLLHIRFNPDESVFVDPVICPRGVKNDIKERMMVFYLGGVRRAADILDAQKQNLPKNIPLLQKMRDYSVTIREIITRGTQIDAIGEILHECWSLKKQLASGISTAQIDDAHRRAREAGALGGKILGAGGAGFLMLWVAPKNRRLVRESLCAFQQIETHLEFRGSRIVFVGGTQW